MHVFECTYPIQAHGGRVGACWQATQCVAGWSERETLTFTRMLNLALLAKLTRTHLDCWRKLERTHTGTVRTEEGIKGQKTVQWPNSMLLQYLAWPYGIFTEYLYFIK